MRIEYDQGTVVIESWPHSVKIPEYVSYDYRINKYRAMACFYRDLM